MSIQWKPLRDSHYVIASLKPGGGGLRQIFARQSVLREIQAIVRGDRDRPVAGLLLGRRLDCALTGTPYVLIESHTEATLAALDERYIRDAIQTLHGRIGRRNSVEVLGWYCSGWTADAAVSDNIAAVHAACFPERWQTFLSFGKDGDSGAFFLHDPSAARWFHAPFYEVTDAKSNGRAPKTTCVAWPAYLTTSPVVALAEAPQPVRVPPAPAPRAAAAHGRPVVIARRTPTRAAVFEAARAAGQSAFGVARSLGGGIVRASHYATATIGRARAEWAARSAQRKAEAEAEREREEARRAREEARRAKEAAERRAAREAEERRAAEVAEQRAAEAEARRAAEAEARRKAAEEAERQRAAAAEAGRKAAEEAARRRAAEAEEAERRRAAEAEEAERRRAAEVEARRQAAEAEARRRADEAEARRAMEAEAKREAAEEAQRRAAAEAEAQRIAAETEARRLAEEAEAEAQRRAAEAEAEAQRKAIEAEEEARRKAAEAEEDARRQAAEAEALRISVQVAAFRKQLARPPVEVEGGTRAAPAVAATPTIDHEDTTVSDGPYRYLALARREGFEVSEKIERGTPEHPETVWLLYEQESGLRLIIVTTDEEVREASLHYNLRTDDDSLLRVTPPEHRDLESRTIYRREPCLTELRARCRRLRATGALERDWKVAPTFQHSVSRQ
jgi:hypothetical protein